MIGFNSSFTFPEEGGRYSPLKMSPLVKARPSSSIEEMSKSQVNKLEYLHRAVLCQVILIKIRHRVRENTSAGRDFVRGTTMLLGLF